MIYHISSRDEWKRAQADGSYTTPSLIDEGFIHCSTSPQVVKVANAFYRGRRNLVLLCINPNAVSAEVKWEDPAHPNPDSLPIVDDSEKFPHIYGAINLDAVTDVVDFPAKASGAFELPPKLMP